MKLHSKHIKYNSLVGDVHSSSMFSQEKGNAMKKITELHKSFSQNPKNQIANLRCNHQASSE